MMNKKLWKQRRFENDNPPHYPCPKCFLGVLKFLRDTINTKITSQAKDYEGSSPPWGTEHVISGILKCSEKSCQEVISFVGDYYDDAQGADDYDGYPTYFTEIKLKFFYPNLRLFPLSKEIPKELQEQIDFSFSHFFNDLSSCANKIRVAVEIILTDIGIAGKTDNGGFISLHNRIEKLNNHTFNEGFEYLENKKEDIQDLLLAIKWIGNEASHIGKVEIGDALDAYESLIEILEMVYIRKYEEVLKNSKEIKELKAPRSKK